MKIDFIRNRIPLRGVENSQDKWKRRKRIMNDEGYYEMMRTKYWPIYKKAQQESKEDAI